MPRESFAGTWEIGVSSTVVREFGTVKCLARVGDLELRASIADVEALESSESLEGVWKIWTESLLADVLLGTLKSGHLPWHQPWLRDVNVYESLCAWGTICGHQGD